MTRTSSFLLSDELADYVRRHTDPVDDLVADLIAETAKLPMANMQISIEQSMFLTILTKVMRPQHVLEIGTFTGYSALSMARGLPPGGRIMALDVSGEWTAIARKYWERAGVADLIDLRLAPALETLASLPEQPQFDFVFIDADKPGYPAYFEATIDRVNSGGLILADNVLRHGRIVEADSDSESIAALRRFNDLMVDDDRVETLILPAFDGLTMALRK